MSSESRAAEVLAEHAVAGVGPGGECWCRCGVGDVERGEPDLWNAERHRAHVAAALAAAGCLADDREGETVTEVCNCGYGGFHEELNKRCALYVTPDGGDQP